MNSKTDTCFSGSSRENRHPHCHGLSYGGILKTCLTPPPDPDGSTTDHAHFRHPGTKIALSAKAFR